MENNFMFVLHNSQEKLNNIVNNVISSYSDSKEGKRIVDHTMSRIKSLESAEKKLLKKGKEPTINNMIDGLNDMVGIRIICPFKSYVYKMSELLINNNDLDINIIEDYIAFSKPSGYSSYHMNVSYPITYGSSIKTVNSEIQIRTMAQDLWATLEHDLRYKLPTYMSDDELTKLNEKFNNSAINIRIFDDDMESLKDRVNKLMSSSSDIKDENNIDKNDDILLDKQVYSSMHADYDEARYKLENLIENFFRQYSEFTGEKLINHTKSRIKPVESVVKKLKKKNKEITCENMIDYISDGVGIRIVCPFLDDVNKSINLIYELLKNTYGEENIEQKDYIKNPKESGYTSYHFYVKVPVSSGNNIKCEIQVRTMAMDLWATLDGELRYKTPEDIQELLNAEFIRSAKDMRNFDIQMQEIKTHVDELKTDKEKVLCKYL